jgi:hypothetical protein
MLLYINVICDAFLKIYALKVNNLEKKSMQFVRCESKAIMVM